MASTFTPNIQLEEPARGDQVGTWDTPVNNNMTLVDLVAGAITTIGLNNSPVVLSAAQFQAKGITFNSTLTGSVAITFPTSFTKSYEIRNVCTGSSTFIVTLGTTAAGAQVVCAPPGQSVNVVNNGTSLYYHNLGGPIGSYLDYGGSSLPAWVSGCSIPPYANCDGTAISSLHTILPIILGSSLLPDSKGRVRAALDQSAGRLSSAVAGFSPNTVGAGGGSQNYQQHTHSITDPGHVHRYFQNAAFGFSGGGAGLNGGLATVAANSCSATTGITVDNSGTGTAGNVQPTYIGGLTLIRAG